VKWTVGPLLESERPGASVRARVPTYEFKCPEGHAFEVFQRMTDPPPDKCPVCGRSPVERVLYPVAVHFKGSGFYSTDYGRGSSKREPVKDAEAGSKSDEGGKKDEKKKPAEA
jgi:putative FmdB family regulatory protein